MTSQMKTFLFLALLTGLLVALGGVIGGRAGLVIGLLFALVMNGVSYWFSDKIVLSMYKAQELSVGDSPLIHSMVDELCAKAGIPKPRIFLIPEQAPNAFATGRNPEHAVVAVTQGLLQTLNPDEIKGVVAHEIGHIRNRDILIQSVASVVGGAITFLANMAQWGAVLGRGNNSGNVFSTLLMAILAPIAATLIQMAISRSREYIADQTGAQISGSPRSLASALGKISGMAQEIPLQRGSQATESMFIISPFSGQNFSSLFATHPPVEERIRRLLDMEEQRNRR